MAFGHSPSVLAITLVAAVAPSTQSQDIAALEAETKKVFRDCVERLQVVLHGLSWHSQDGSGINFAPTLAAPGAPSSTKTWKQALANIKTHDMPPADAKMQPTDAEREMFVDWIGKLKFLSPKDQVRLLSVD